MATTFTCPHCGHRTTTTQEVEWVDFDNGCGDQAFPVLPEGVERHIDMRLCCQGCYDRAAERLVPGDTHPYDPQCHAERLEACNNTNRR